jgi:hypothetical protein
LSEKDSRGKINKVKEYLKNRSRKCGAARKASPAA